MARDESFAGRLASELTKRVFDGRGSGPKKVSPLGVLLLVAVLAYAAFLRDDDRTPERGASDKSVATSVETDAERGFSVEPSTDSFSSSGAGTSAGAIPTRSVPDVEIGKIERCVDGDTLVVKFDDGATERIRLIGSNTPETVKPNWPVEPFGPEASAFTKRRVEEAGGVATFVADGDARDKYGRRLAFVYLDGSQVSLNEELARNGLAKAETRYRYSKEMKNRLTAAENAARREKLGIWSGTK